MRKDGGDIAGLKKIHIFAKHQQLPTVMAGTHRQTLEQLKQNN